MWRVVIISVVAAAACGGGNATPPEPETALSAAGPAPSTTTTVNRTTAAEEEDLAMEVDDVEPEPAFSHSVRMVTAADLGVSWRKGCPVGLDELRLVEIAHWDDSGASVTGALVIHEDHVEPVVAVFEALFDAGFPIHSMRPITDFDADDNASMRANNTSAFNCREIDGSPGTWSQHAFGGAVDINPLVNPWVRGDRVDPAEGERYTDRTLDVMGLIKAGDVVTRAFADVGWAWGGDWRGTKDYQHFSATGR